MSAAPGQAPQKPGIGTRSGADDVLARQVNAQVPRGGCRSLHRTLPGNTEIEQLRDRAYTSPHAFLVAHGFVYPGTWNAAYPTLGGDPLSERLEIALTGVGEEHVYLKLTYNLTASASGYVYASSLTSAIIESKNTLEENPTGPHASTFYILLASFLSGRKTAQPVSNSLAGDVCDSGLGNSTGVLQFENAG